MNVQFRDVRYAVPFLVQAWMFATPIAYPSSLLDEPWRTLYGINPMAGVVEGFRWALLGTAGHGDCAWPDRSGFGAGVSWLAGQRRFLLPPHGKDVCRRRLIAHFKTRVCSFTVN
jgi:ABC-type polysaccharide/polyol phosphate export permease